VVGRVLVEGWDVRRALEVWSSITRREEAMAPAIRPVFTCSALSSKSMKPCWASLSTDVRPGHWPPLPPQRRGPRRHSRLSRWS